MIVNLWLRWPVFWVGFFLLGVVASSYAVESPKESLTFRGVQLTEKKGNERIWDLEATSVKYGEKNIAQLEEPKILFYQKSSPQLQVLAQTAVYRPNEKLFSLFRNVRLYSPIYRLQIVSPKVICNYPQNTIETFPETHGMTEEGITFHSQKIRGDLSLQRVELSGPVQILIPVEEE